MSTGVGVAVIGTHVVAGLLIDFDVGATREVELDSILSVFSFHHHLTHCQVVVPETVDTHQFNGVSRVAEIDEFLSAVLDREDDCGGNSRSNDNPEQKTQYLTPPAAPSCGYSLQQQLYRREINNGDKIYI